MLSRSKELIATVKEIRLITGCPSVSCGVLHEGRDVFIYSDGLASVEDNRPANEHSVYSIASNTKAFITALCGILVEDGYLSWSEPISSYLPEFETVFDHEISKRATLFDLCSHSTGLAPLDNSGTGFFWEFWNPGSDGIQISSNLPIAYDFRSRWLYNNYLLDVVGAVISRVCHKRSGLVLRERIFEPLGMHRTFSRNDEYDEDDNVARGYGVLDHGPPLLQSPPALEDGALQGASGYIRSSVHDMLLWAKAVLGAEEAEEDHFSLKSTDPKTDTTNPLKQITQARSAHRPVVLGAKGYENSYGLGWFRHMLPSKFLSSIGPNFALLPDPPIVNKDGPPRLTVAHWGNFGGYLSAFYTFLKLKVLW